MSASLLVEIHTEELPPLALNNLARSFATSIHNQLVESGFCQAGDFKWFASPRRIAVKVANVVEAQQDQLEEKRGPSIRSAYDDQGNPTKATLGFAKSLGVDVKEFETLKTDKGEWLVLKRMVKGRSLDEVLAEFINSAIKQLPVPKRMRWGRGDYEFVRPVHKIIALYGSKIVKGSVLGIDFSNSTRGHRVKSDGAEIVIADADSYLNTLETEGFVFADASARSQVVKKQVAELANEKGGIPYHPDSGWDEELLELVTALVEYPQAIIGEIDDHYMQLPLELLVTSMKDHQKYFPVFDKNGGLMPYFITVANIELKDPARVVAGNQRVLRARLDDAEFFWKTDAKKSLEERRTDLNRVLYHVKIGSVGERVERMREGLNWLVKNIDVRNEDVKNTLRVIELMKVDLVSEVVGEFPELQGTIGRYYAARDGEENSVALAIEEHYLPRFAGDDLPQSNPGLLAALVERFDSLITLFSAGEAPSGTRDRYALRRQAFGLIRLILNLGSAISISDTIAKWPNPNAPDEEVKYAIHQFIIERLRHELVQMQQYDDDVFNAVTAIENDDLVDIRNRVHSLSKFVTEDKETAQKLASGLKRAGNFLSKAETEMSNLPMEKDLLKEKEELALFEAVDKAGDDVAAAMEQKDYKKALNVAAELQPAIDDFFEQILVLDENTEIRNARLALLKSTHAVLTQVADITHLH